MGTKCHSMTNHYYVLTNQSMNFMKFIESIDQSINQCIHITAFNYFAGILNVVIKDLRREGAYVCAERDLWALIKIYCSPILDGRSSDIHDNVLRVDYNDEITKKGSRQVSLRLKKPG